ncbi:MAG: thioredoxin [Patescibacteria group bacterium]|nr:thioredoxin [Patescibacteria group bacterium]
MSVVTLNDSNFKSEVEEATGVVVIDFYADWCGPCKMMAPIFEETAGEVKDAKFGKLNVDEARETAMRFNVMSIPTLIVFKDGKVVNQVAGVQDKEALKRMVSEA